MQQGEVKITLSGVSETLLGPLWGRAKISKEHSVLFYDAKAVELVEKIDHDFSTRDKVVPGYLPFLFVVRAQQFDEKVKAYITERPRASIVNIGAGLDTTFYRVDNGLIHWYDLDLPPVIDIRKQLLPEPGRVTYIAKSLLDPSWCKDVKQIEEGVFMIAGGVLRYFEEAQVRQFFSLLVDNLPGGEIVFDAQSTFDDSFRAWRNQFPPEQRDAMRTARMEGLKGAWEKASQDLKDELIATLTVPIKPKGAQWADIEALWNQLGDGEKEEVWNVFRILSNWGLVKWTLEDAKEITKWDDRITVLDQVPLYRDIPRDSVSADIRHFMDYSDRRKMTTIIHLRV
jgi:O-methyltransferase involved in polyketide biosynthesis